MWAGAFGFRQPERRETRDLLPEGHRLDARPDLGPAQQPSALEPPMGSVRCTRRRTVRWGVVSQRGVLRLPGAKMVRELLESGICKWGNVRAVPGSSTGW